MVLQRTFNSKLDIPAREARTPSEGAGSKGDETLHPGEGAPSPFIPGTSLQFAWDSTCLEALKKCPRFYQLSYIDNWRLKGDAIHLRFGGEMGLSIDGYTRSVAEGKSHDDAIHDSVRALMDRIQSWDPEPRTRSEELKSKENLVRTVVWYLDHYEHDAAKVVTLSNGKPAVELSFKFELDFGPNDQEIARLRREDTREWSRANEIEEAIDRLDTQRYTICGHLDKVVEFSGDQFVMDHKTTSTTPGPYYFDGYNPHNQMSLYTLASQIILQTPIKGVIIDAIQIAVGFSRFTRGITYRTGDHLEEWMADLRRWLRAAEGYNEEGHWPMNDTSCSMYGGCRFRDVCSKSPKVRQRWLESNFTQDLERWNPLKPR